MTQIRVLLADDHVLFLQGVRALLSARPDVQVAGEAGDGEQAVQKARALRPDVVLMDVHMPGTDGIQAARRIKEELPGTWVIMLTVSDEDDDLFEALKAGADGYLLKNVHPEELAKLLHGVMRGEAALSPAVAARVLGELRRRRSVDAPAGTLAAMTAREREVLTLVAHGLSNKEIASRLVVTEGTVKNHLHHILEKLHLQNRVQAAALAVEEGLTTAERDTNAE